MQVREKVGKSRDTVFFQLIVAPEGRKVGSLKRRGRSHLARCEMKNCTPFWHEDVEKVHAVVARSTFRSKNVQNTPTAEHFWKMRWSKSAQKV